MSKLTIALLALALGAGGVQFFQPSFENPPVAQAATFEAVAKPPAQVAEILNRSCGDCHSNNTHYPWYAKVAPASWLLDHDIRTGRAHLNFSTWNYSGEMSKLRMAEVCDVIRNGRMPDSKYLLLHPEAALSEADKAAVCAFTPAD